MVPSLHTFPCCPVKIFSFVPKLWSFDCICNSSGIAARCYYSSRDKSSLWLICCPVSLSKMLFVAVLVCGGTQGNSSHIPGVGKQSDFNTGSISCTLSSRGSSSCPLGLLLSLPSAVRSSCTSSSLPSPAARHLSSFHLNMFSGPEPQKFILPFPLEAPIFLVLIQLLHSQGGKWKSCFPHWPFLSILQFSVLFHLLVFSLSLWEIKGEGIEAAAQSAEREQELEEETEMG